MVVLSTMTVYACLCRILRLEAEPTVRTDPTLPGGVILFTVSRDGIARMCVAGSRVAREDRSDSPSLSSEEQSAAAAAFCEESPGDPGTAGTSSAATCAPGPGPKSCHGVERSAPCTEPGHHQSKSVSKSHYGSKTTNAMNAPQGAPGSPECGSSWGRRGCWPQPRLPSRRPQR
jgi:hypothetical protein